ncbi:MAG: helix-hairpin-helix domain-containing protein, partial [Nitrososphaerales archaeon]
MPLKFGNILPGTLESNRNVAEHLQLISMAMALEPKPAYFKIKAFETAAEGLVLSPSDVRYVDPRTISGVGDSVAEVIRDFLETGTSKRLEALSKQFPVEALSMCKVDGIGPKTALKFHAEGIKNFDELVKAAKAEDCKLKDKVRDAVLFAVKKERVPHAEAKALSGQVVDELYRIVACSAEMKSNGSTLRLEVCGSIRRHTVDSKDVDIVGCVADKADVGILLDEFVKIGTKISRGENRGSIRFTYQGRTMQVDLWLVPPESYGSALNYATGNTTHNIELRKMAMA